MQLPLKRRGSRGHTLVELLIVLGIALFVLQAVYFLQSGFLRLFKDVKARSENIQNKIPAVEVVSRYFDRWGVNVVANGVEDGCDCASYPPSASRCITVTTDTIDGNQVCDRAVFWGNIYGFGFVSSVTSGTATLASCRLSRDTGHNHHYMWSSDTLYNDVVKDASGNITYIVPLGLDTATLSTNNADCSSLTSASPTNVTVSSTMSPWDIGYFNKVLQAGDVLMRAPHRVTLYCAKNASDNNQLWLYSRLRDTVTNSDEDAEAIAPVAYETRPNGTTIKGLEVQLLPAGCNPLTGGCTGARVFINFRSQAQTTDRQFKTQRVERVYSR